MSKKLEKAITILEKRIHLLDARLKTMDEDYSNFHELREERAAMQRILDFVNVKKEKDKSE